MPMQLKGKKILLGLSGGVACYKAAELCRALTREGATVHVVMTEAAGHFWRRCVYLQPDHYDALCHLALLAENTGEAAQASAFRQRAARVYGRRGGATRKQS